MARPAIRFELAAGRTLDQVRQTFADPKYADLELVSVVDWLAQNFQVRSWYELKSHPKDPEVS